MKKYVILQNDAYSYIDADRIAFQEGNGTLFFIGSTLVGFAPLNAVIAPKEF